MHWTYYVWETIFVITHVCDTISVLGILCVRHHICIWHHMCGTQYVLAHVCGDLVMSESRWLGYGLVCFWILGMLLLHQNCRRISRENIIIAVSITCNQSMNMCNSMPITLNASLSVRVIRSDINV